MIGEGEERGSEVGFFLGKVENFRDFLRGWNNFEKVAGCLRMGKICICA